jgi:hypothetical protein
MILHRMRIGSRLWTWLRRWFDRRYPCIELIERSRLLTADEFKAAFKDGAGPPLID